MEPDILVGREKPSQFWTDNPNDIAQHRDKDRAAIEGQNKACAARSPDGETQSIETS